MTFKATILVLLSVIAASVAYMAWNASRPSPKPASNVSVAEVLQYANAIRHSEAMTCKANEQNMANSVQGIRVKTVGADYGPTIRAGVTSLIPELSDNGNALQPCPAGGAYSIECGSSGDNKTFRIRCSLHGTFEPGVDSSGADQKLPVMK